MKPHSSDLIEQTAKLLGMYMHQDKDGIWYLRNNEGKLITHNSSKNMPYFIYYMKWTLNNIYKIDI